MEQNKITTGHTAFVGSQKSSAEGTFTAVSICRYILVALGFELMALLLLARSSTT
jgi:hypothetical protein